MFNIKVKRGQVYFADLGATQGSEQGGYRPVLIIQNDIGNAHSTTTIVAPITSATKRFLPTHYLIGNHNGLRSGLVLCEQIRTIDKGRLRKYVCDFTEEQMAEVNKCIMNSLGL